MKNILFAIAFIFTLSLGASAQSYTDSFVDWADSDVNRDVTWAIVFPTTHFTNTDQNGSPLGSGLLVLTALGAGYAVSARRKKKNNYKHHTTFNY